MNNLIHHCYPHQLTFFSVRAVSPALSYPFSPDPVFETVFDFKDGLKLLFFNQVLRKVLKLW